MTGLEWLLAVAGALVTALVIAGMILLTPRGAVDAEGESIAGKDAREETAADAAERLRDTAYEAGDIVRDFVEQRPYTTAFAALCVGWFIGRMGRRDY